MSTPSAEPARLLAADPVSLAAKDVHLSFGSNAVLRGVDLEVPAGSTAAIIGPSGSGKSTLLRTLNRLHEPDRGDILLDGRSVLKDDPNALRQRIGMVFQHFNLFPHRTVLDNVTLAPRKLKRLGGDEARELGLAQLDRVGLRHKADVRPATLSGGQQQRVAIARALAMAPQLMFFDEATSALDPELVKGILALIAELEGRRPDAGGGHARDGLRAVDGRHRGLHGPRSGAGVRATPEVVRSRRNRAAATFPFTGSVNRSIAPLSRADRLDCQTMVETEPQVTELAGELQATLSKLFSVLRRTDSNRNTTERGADLTLAQLSILLTLLDQGPMRMTELAAHERVRTPTTTVAIRRLEKLGLVKRSRDPSDLRAVLVDVTPRGLVQHREALATRRAALAAMLSKLTTDERTTLAGALTSLARLAEQAEG